MFSSIVTELPWEIIVKLIHDNECKLTFGWKNIREDVIKTMGLLKEFVDSPLVAMKMVRFIIFHLLEKDTNGIHLVPVNEELSITKVDERGGSSIFSYKSDPARDMLNDPDCKNMTTLIGVHPKRKWLASVLWLLSEWAVNQFGRQDSSLEKPKQELFVFF